MRHSNLAIPSIEHWISTSEREKVGRNYSLLFIIEIYSWAVKIWVHPLIGFDKAIFNCFHISNCLWRCVFVNQFLEYYRWLKSMEQRKYNIIHSSSCKLFLQCDTLEISIKFSDLLLFKYVFVIDYCESSRITQTKCQATSTR